MIQRYDFFGHAEMPSINLCNPDKSPLYSISQLINNDKLQLRFNALSEFKFDIPSSIDGGLTILDCYDFIQSKRLISISDIGYFIISKVTEKTDGEYPHKFVECRSLDAELIAKKLTVFKGTYKFYDATHTTTNLIDTILEYIPSWTIGYIDPDLWAKYRTFNITDSTVYAFLTIDVEKAYQCVFLFDTDLKTVSAYTTTNVTTNTDIYLSFQNLIKQSDFKEISDEIVTALRVYGGNSLSIRAVNPLGGNIIYNFDYFKNDDWMSQDLQDAITAWELAISVAQPTYSTNLSTLKTLNGQLLDLTLNVTTGLNKLETDLLALEAQQQADVVAIPPNPATIAADAAAITAKQVEITAKELEITNKEAEVTATEAILTGISSSLSIASNFTVSQIEDLSLFTYENSYTNENIIVTDSMTPVEYQEQSQILYDQGIVVLEKASVPRYEFNINTANFIALQEFQTFTNQLELGAVITVNISDSSTITTVLLEIETSFNEPDNFKLSFSNRLRLDNGDFQYSDLLGQAAAMSSSVVGNELTWEDWSINYKDTVSTFITSSLDASVNSVVNATNQEMVIGPYGLRGRTLLSPNNYSPEQLWVTNDVVAFTDDNWQSAKLALGKMTTPGGVVYGLVADVIVGRLLAGNELTITNDDGIAVKTFTLDQDGAVLQNASFTIENAGTKILLDPMDGIKVQKNIGTIPSPSWEDKFYVDSSGNVFLSGDITGSNGTFSGTLNAVTGNFSGEIVTSSGYIGGWTITSDGIQNENAACNLLAFSDGSSDNRLGNFVSVRNSDGSFAWIDFTGNTATIRGRDWVEIDGDNNLFLNFGGDFSMWFGGVTYINGSVAITDTIDVSSTPNLVFEHGLLVGYS